MFSRTCSVGNLLRLFKDLGPPSVNYLEKQRNGAANWRIDFSGHIPPRVRRTCPGKRVLHHVKL